MTSPTTSADAVKVLRELAAILGAKETKTASGLPVTVPECMDVMHAAAHEIRGAITLLTQHAEAGAVAWSKGEPPKWFTESFIAVLDNGDRLVLRRLPEEYAYDYTTADGTYYMARLLKKWMQFPDSQFKCLAEHPAQPASQQGEKVDYGDALLLTRNAQAMQAHPTGDKVRSLPAKWMREAEAHRDWARKATSEVTKIAFEGLADGIELRAHELTAALDQEKNDGR